ncbi:MBL fold metallo-hydrolase [Jannaschia pagri]|uniref:MBL fold metallo-hydrolase n=1 Tax=Jannaschia pagri TaxID=2829797 RepID=A0ABQ4NRX5_9RHOB|nr:MULTISPECIES: MBL fold metallo-hydrolase [unclassified Jannaschia]GIT93002.1 MBL fold metallo-hydrolase [Jannaschia sp. AI_61]GIT96837.1 MBL fold metallo-hydrolase [Jannaschia sp. AI_62]
MHRRSFLAASVAALTVPRLVSAQIDLSEGATLTTVSDGHLTLPSNMIFDPMPQDDLSAVLNDFGMSGPQLTPDCNLALLQQGDRVVLFDAGAGSDFQLSAGRLLDGLDHLGIDPESVTDVVFTHAHPDHIWGVLDDFGDPLFSQSTHHIGATEMAYWSDPQTVESIGTARASFAVGAKRRLEAIADQLQTFDHGQEVVPGVEAILTPGHTPGHMAFDLGGAIVLGDAIGNHHVAFARPEWLSGSDQDQALAAETRVALFDRISADDRPVVGFHLPQGGIGQVEKGQDGYRFVAS